MYLQSLSVLQSNVVIALTFLSTSSASLTGSPPYLEVSPQLHDKESASDQCEKDEDSIRERQEAVAEAIKWGSSTRRNAGSRPGSDFFSKYRSMIACRSSFFSS
ncbi:hypothetical protein Droror1_Dr00000705 [Drosera rotundifolia]